jgi:putative membrane protein
MDPTTESQRDTTARLSEGQILAVTGVATSSDAVEGRMGRDKANSARVSRFAEQLILDQRSLAAQHASLTRKYPGGTTPLSASLDAERSELVQSLRTSHGASFDRAFIESQIKDAQAMLKLIDRELMPSARTPDMKDFLQNLRARTIAHLLAAQEIQIQLP